MLWLKSKIVLFDLNTKKIDKNVPNMISVVRLRESMMDSLQLYRLSYLVLITLSFTFIAGAHNFPAWDIWYKRWTPVTLSSTMPCKEMQNEVGCLFSAKILFPIILCIMIDSYFTLKVPTLKMELNFLTIRWVASPPSSSSILGCQFSALIHLVIITLELSYNGLHEILILNLLSFFIIKAWSILPLNTPPKVFFWFSAPSEYTYHVFS